MEPKNFVENSRFPRERIEPVIREWIAKHEADHERDAATPTVGNGEGYGEWRVPQFGALNRLAHESGVSHRVLFRVLNGPSESEIAKQHATGDHVTLSVVDRLFTAMGCVHLFHMEPEDGGFADIYFHESVTDPESWAEKVKERVRRRNKLTKLRHREIGP